jgi:hypothetical protein
MNNYSGGVFQHSLQCENNPAQMPNSRRKNEDVQLYSDK